VERRTPKVLAIDVGDLELAAGRGLEARGDLDHVVVVEIEPGDGPARSRAYGLLLERQHAAAGVELHHAVALRVA
jgi:hypothetical protein